MQEETSDGVNEPTSFNVGPFEGPLDLLLFLIKKNEVNIYDIPIAKITEQYLGVLQYLTHYDLENLTDFYLMAATLLYIKSRMLLPFNAELDEEYEDPRKSLVDRLIEYYKFKHLSGLMQEKEEDAEWMIERKHKQPVLSFFNDDDLWHEIDVWELCRSFGNLMQGLAPERIISLYEEISINEKVALIDELLEEKGQFTFVELIKRPQSILDIVCAFLAVLDSVKNKKICIFQNRMFGDILIKIYQPQERYDLGERNIPD